MSKQVFLLMVIFCSANFLRGQEITFKGQANKTEVSVNERFVVQFVLTYGQENLSVDKPLKMPDFDGLTR